MKDIIINLNGSANCERLRARMIWQKLFDISQNKTMLSGMGHMLCDYHSLACRCQPRESFTCYWGYSGCNTSMSNSPLLVYTYDNCYKIEYRQEESKVIISKMERKTDE